MATGAITSTAVRLGESAREAPASSSDSPARDPNGLLEQADASRNSIMRIFDRPQSDAERAVSALLAQIPDPATVRMLAGTGPTRIVAWLVPADSVCAAILTGSDDVGPPVCTSTEQAASGGMTIATDAAGVTTLQWGEPTGFPPDLSGSSSR